MALTGEINSLMQNIDGSIDGVRGARGYSAYEVAVQDGYVGTEEEWLASLKGDKGDKGEKGDRGEQGIQGIQGIQGEKGDKGDQGIQGEHGVPGQDGTDGQDGFSPVATVTKSGSTATITITDANGTTTATVSDGTDGQDGYTPIRGTDYWTSADKAEIASEASTAATNAVNAISYKESVAELVQTAMVVSVSGSTPVIVGEANYRYVCGEVATLDFTPSASGICDVVFTSGSTATVLTLPNAVILPSWFDATALDTDTTYEISISDGVYGAVMIW